MARVVDRAGWTSGGGEKRGGSLFLVWACTKKKLAGIMVLENGFAFRLYNYIACKGKRIARHWVSV
jgi:hypothetical protein